MAKITIENGNSSVTFNNVNPEQFHHGSNNIEITQNIEPTYQAKQKKYRENQIITLDTAIQLMKQNTHVKYSIELMGKNRNYNLKFKITGIHTGFGRINNQKALTLSQLQNMR